MVPGGGEEEKKKEGEGEGSSNDDDKDLTSWATVEHFYQAQKFTHPPSSAALLSDPSDLQASRALVEAIRAAPTPVDAASLGRAAQRSSPRLVRADWEDAKLDVMVCGLRAKFAKHEKVREALLATAPRPIAEASPSDHFWGSGVDGSGCNHLGRLLAEVRAELLLLLEGEEELSKAEAAAAEEGGTGGGAVGDVGLDDGHHHSRHAEQQQQSQQQHPSKSTPVVR